MCSAVLAVTPAEAVLWLLAALLSLSCGWLLVALPAAAEELCPAHLHARYSGRRWCALAAALPRPRLTCQLAALLALLTALGQQQLLSRLARLLPAALLLPLLARLLGRSRSSLRRQLFGRALGIGSGLAYQTFFGCYHLIGGHPEFEQNWRRYVPEGQQTDVPVPLALSVHRLFVLVLGDGFMPASLTRLNRDGSRVQLQYRGHLPGLLVHRAGIPDRVYGNHPVHALVPPGGGPEKLCLLEGQAAVGALAAMFGTQTDPSTARVNSLQQELRLYYLTLKKLCQQFPSVGEWMEPIYIPSHQAPVPDLIWLLLERRAPPAVS